MNETTVQNLDTLTKCAEQVNNIFTIVYKIAVNAKYPAFSQIVNAAEELNNEIFLLQNYLINPNAEEILDAVKEQQQKISLTNKLSQNAE
jgi:hypothetical protein